MDPILSRWHANWLLRRWGSGHLGAMRNAPSAGGALFTAAMASAALPARPLVRRAPFERSHPVHNFQYPDDELVEHHIGEIRAMQSPALVSGGKVGEPRWSTAAALLVVEQVKRSGRRGKLPANRTCYRRPGWFSRGSAAR